MRNKKQFRLRADQIKCLAPNHGGCIATDMITVNGEKVGFMYRQEAHNELDSGWMFLSGSESQEYLDEAANSEVYDVNTIANYDPAIIPYLHAPVGSAFESDPKTGFFVEVDAPPVD